MMQFFILRRLPSREEEEPYLVRTSNDKPPPNCRIFLKTQTKRVPNSGID